MFFFLCTYYIISSIFPQTGVFSTWRGSYSGLKKCASVTRLWPRYREKFCPSCLPLCFLLNCPKLPPKMLPQVASQDFAPSCLPRFCPCCLPKFCPKLPPKILPLWPPKIQWPNDQLRNEQMAKWPNEQMTKRPMTKSANAQMKVIQWPLTSCLGSRSV